MPKKNPSLRQNRASNVSLYPLTPDEAIKAVLSISKDDAKRIVASASKNKRKTK